MAKPKKPAKYDLKAADRKRNMWIQIALVAIVAVFAAGVVGFVVIQGKSKEHSRVTDAGRAIRVASSNVVSAEGTNDPKVVISMYEDFLCPACGMFERAMGPTISKLIDAGAVAADYRMVAILDSGSNDYSSRSGAAAYCVADESIDAFRRFHAELYDVNIQPDERGPNFPDNTKIIEYARQAGAAGGVRGCIERDTYTDMVKSMAETSGIHSTPTIRINGEDYAWSTPEALVAKVKDIVGDLPDLDKIATDAPAAPAAPPLPPAPAAPPAAPAAPHGPVAPAAPAPAKP